MLMGTLRPSIIAMVDEFRVALPILRGCCGFVWFCFVIAIHGNWISAIPCFALSARMTDFLVLGESFFYSVSRLSW
jgi:CHASE2 domain-containing sensor protein